MRHISLVIQVQSIMIYCIFSKTKSIWWMTLLSNSFLINATIFFLSFVFWSHSCLEEYHSIIQLLKIFFHRIWSFFLSFLTKQYQHFLHLYFCFHWLFFPFNFTSVFLHFGQFFLHIIKVIIKIQQYCILLTYLKQLFCKKQHTILGFSPFFGGSISKA